MAAVALEGLEDAELAFGLDSLGDDGQAERVREPDDGGDDGPFALVLFELVDEGLVDLDEVEGELA